MSSKYTLGIDFGTRAARVVLAEVETGQVTAQATRMYSNGVLGEYLPDGAKLPPDWALQHPQDYLEVLESAVPTVMRGSGVRAKDVIGMAVDFTSCTVLPVDREGAPLCFQREFRNAPHAWPKLWKHHAAQYEANKLNETAGRLDRDLLLRYGGKISAEWMIPKIMQILDEAPAVYEAADRFMEAGDWITMQLTGQEARNVCAAGYKALWSKQKGYPSKEFFKAVDPRLENLVEEKLGTNIYPQGTKAGELTAAMAEKTGLLPGTAVAVGNIDAHAALPAVGITEPNQLLMIMGTSTCDIMCSREEKMVPGICGVVEDGVLPGYFGYEAGQSCVGDHFAWMADHCVPASYYQEAEDRGMGILALLGEKAAGLRAGESGLLALDWWNGNRSVLVDADLTGMILGLTLDTKAEEIYRALIEATAFGQRMIIDNFQESGIPVDKLYACGTIAKKDAVVMQIYADVTNREISIGAFAQCSALGAAMYGAVAAGASRGGYDSILDAARIMGGVEEKTYQPIPENAAVYESLYREFRVLHDYFGKGENSVMKRLKEVKKQVR